MSDTMLDNYRIGDANVTIYLSSRGYYSLSSQTHWDGIQKLRYTGYGPEIIC